MRPFEVMCHDFELTAMWVIEAQAAIVLHVLLSCEVP